ncbi:MAG TPA: hypothetical protein VLA42_05035 [Verrucomicrobiae bacterium]|jgi:hypothetical protein|nr:hypothetical protein [Verrucomicrobiae bacterium]
MALDQKMTLRGKSETIFLYSSPLQLTHAHLIRHRSSWDRYSSIEVEMLEPFEPRMDGILAPALFLTGKQT